MKTRIIVDSTADLLPAVKNRVYTVPLTVRFGNEEFIDGVTIDSKSSYEKLIECDALPTTSQATPDGFIQQFEAAKQAGEAVVVITLSAKLSGTYQSAVIAAQEYPGRIFVVDSRSAAIGSGILAELALHYTRENLSAAEIAAQIEHERDNVCVIAMLDTLEYLKKGGRISKTAAFAGGLLSIKPVVAIKDGEIVMLGKARGSKQGNNLLVKEIQNAGGIDFAKPILLGYTGLSDVLLQKYIADSRNLWECGTESLRSTIIGSVIGTHAGPGAIAAAFFKA